MDKDKLKDILNNVKNGSLSIDDALHNLKTLPYEDVDFAKIDRHRALRTGFPEVIFCQGKTIPHIVTIMEKLLQGHGVVLATRAWDEVYQEIKKVRPDAVYNENAKIVQVGKPKEIPVTGKVLIITAGTADIPVAEEAAMTAEAMGCNVERLYDVGVAGVHRLFQNVKLIYEASAIVVAAGMDGALPSIIGGVADVPVVAVPTSVGYGASFAGVAPLLTMLNSCAPGVAVVNIDNGFGAGYFAGMLTIQKEEHAEKA